MSVFDTRLAARLLTYSSRSATWPPTSILAQDPRPAAVQCARTGVGMCVYVCVCVCKSVCVCVCACVWARGRARAGKWGDVALVKRHAVQSMEVSAWGQALP